MFGVADEGRLPATVTTRVMWCPAIISHRAPASPTHSCNCGVISHIVLPRFRARQNGGEEAGNCRRAPTRAPLPCGARSGGHGRGLWPKSNRWTCKSHAIPTQHPQALSLGVLRGSGFHSTLWTVPGSPFRMVAASRSISDGSRPAFRALHLTCVRLARVVEGLRRRRQGIITPVSSLRAVAEWRGTS